MQFKLNHTDFIINSLYRISRWCLNDWFKLSYAVNESPTRNWPMPISNRSHILHTHRVERHTSEERSKARKVQCFSPWRRTFVFSILTTEKSDPVFTRNPHLCLHSCLLTSVVAVYKINCASVRSSGCKKMWKNTVIFLFFPASDASVPSHTLIPLFFCSVTAWGWFLNERGGYRHQRFNPAPYRYFVINNRWIE